MSFLIVDKDKCTGCGLCAKDCPIRSIRMENRVPVEAGPFCIGCGHCVAICPERAMDNSRNPLAEQKELKRYPVIEAETAKDFLRSRRSIRNFKEKAVPQELIAELLDAGRFADTGGNSQGISYLVLSDKKVMGAMTAAIVDWMESTAAANPVLKNYFSAMIEGYRKHQEDLILRGAPHLVIALASNRLQSPQAKRDNAYGALVYIELYATALGLGTCWAGFVEWCASTHYKPLLDLLALPADKSFAGAMMAGFPQHNYRRLVARKPLEITWR